MHSDHYDLDSVGRKSSGDRYQQTLHEPKLRERRNDPVEAVAAADHRRLLRTADVSLVAALEDEAVVGIGTDYVASGTFRLATGCRLTDRDSLSQGQSRQEDEARLRVHGVAAGRVVE